MGILYGVSIFTSETFTFVSVSNASPPGRYDHAAIATSDGRLVIIGGRDASGTALKDIWAFDPLAKKKLSGILVYR